MRWQWPWAASLAAALLVGCGGGGGGGDDEPAPTPTEPLSCNDLVLDKTALPPLPAANSYAGNPLYYQQWAIHYDADFYRRNGIDPDASIHMDGDHRFTGRGVRVAVIDDGLDVTHEDLLGAVYATYDVATNGTDVSPRSDDENHGTEVTGVIAARNNGVGPVGVAPEAQIYFIRLPFERKIYVDDIVEAFAKAKAWGADVVNCSWGSGDVDDAVRVAIADLAANGRNGKGTVVVFAAGNSGTDIGNDESSLAEVIAVGATNRENLRSYYSNFGQALDVMAPGGEYIGITTLDQMGLPGYGGEDLNYLLYDDYFAFGGTSASAPIVTGVVAQLLQANPNLTFGDVYGVLTCTADKIGNVTYDASGFNPLYGYGKVNANAALSVVR